MNVNLPKCLQTKPFLQMIVHIQLTENHNVLCGYHLVAKDCDFHVLISMERLPMFWKADPVNQVPEYFEFV